MDERFLVDARDRPLDVAHDGSSIGDGGGAAVGAGPLADPRALTILTTEHWSLLSARGLVYNEAFARAGMFLTFLSTTLVGLGVFSAASGLGTTFLVIVAVVLGVDLFVGMSSMGRILSASSEDIRMLQGMNRLRHAYHEMVPGLGDYFIAGEYDDIRGVFAIYGVRDPRDASLLQSVLHGLTTVTGAIGVICATLAGVEAGVLAALLGAGDLACIVIAVAAFVFGVAVAIFTMQTMVRRLAARTDVKFPSPPPERSPEQPAEAETRTASARFE